MVDGVGWVRVSVWRETTRHCCLTRLLIQLKSTRATESEHEATPHTYREN